MAVKEITSETTNETNVSQRISPASHSRPFLSNLTIPTTMDNLIEHPLNESEEEEIREFLMLERTFEQQEQAQNQLMDQLSAMFVDGKGVDCDSSLTEGARKVGFKTTEKTDSNICDPHLNSSINDDNPIHSNQCRISMMVAIIDNNVVVQSSAHEELTEDEDYRSSTTNTDEEFRPGSHFVHANHVTTAITTGTTTGNHDSCRKSFTSGREVRRRPSKRSQIRFAYHDSSMTESSSSDHNGNSSRMAFQTSDGDSIRSKGNQSINPPPQQRPLTIYMPNPNEDLDLVTHIQTLGHDLGPLESQVKLGPTSCSGYLWKQCSGSTHNWRKRFFHFDRKTKQLSYFGSVKDFKKFKTPKGGVSFEQIENVYVDHSRNVCKLVTVGKTGGGLRPGIEPWRRFRMRLKGLNHHTLNQSHRQVFVIKSESRDFVLSTFIPELMRVWIDVIFTGAEAYLDY